MLRRERARQPQVHWGRCGSLWAALLCHAPTASAQTPVAFEYRVAAPDANRCPSAQRVRQLVEINLGTFPFVPAAAGEAFALVVDDVARGALARSCRASDPRHADDRADLGFWLVRPLDRRAGVVAEPVAGIRPSRRHRFPRGARSPSVHGPSHPTVAAQPTAPSASASGCPFETTNAPTSGTSAGPGGGVHGGDLAHSGNVGGSRRLGRDARRGGWRGCAARLAGPTVVDPRRGEGRCRAGLVH